MKPDPAKVELTRNLADPNTKKKFPTFLGMLNFMSSFTPNSLANENTVYQWNDSHIIAFEKIKDRISADTLLAYYD